METVYRDYGVLGNGTGPKNDFNVTSHTQVYQATHMGDGPNNRLPYMNRSFISFTYSDIDGPLVHIEDFNLIATITGDRWERDGYTQFNDLTTDYDNLDGQYYWGTHYKSHSITFNLATDGMDQKQLDDFLNWFRAGVSRELILSEHPNRAQMARVQEPPQLSLLPFESQTTMKISDIEYPITTTLYKGEITLTLIMDEPHWYAKDNILGTKVTETVDNITRTYYTNQWTDANGELVDIFASQDALKILYEDGIPLGTMIENNMLLGNKAYASVENNAESQIWSIEKDEDIEWNEGIPSGSGARIHGIVTQEYVDEMAAQNPSIIVKSAPSDVGYVGRIAGAIIDASGNGISQLDAGTQGYFFYAGTAPSPTIISFSITPHFDNDGYFDAINNSFTNENNPYSTITIESEHTQVLKLTTPNLLTSYNKAIKILKSNTGTNIQIVRKLIRDEVRHPAIREWVANILSEDNVSIASLNIKNLMTAFFYDTNESKYQPMTFSFNSKTGEAIGEFIYHDSPSNINNFVEDVGDMLKSNGIYISDRNHPNTFGKVVNRDTTTVTGRTYSHAIYHDFSQPINNLQIVYKNMYL